MKTIQNNCVVCGKEYTARARAKSTCCSIACRGKRAASLQTNGGRKPTHSGCINGKRSPLYSRWSGIIARCHQTASTSYPEYGGKGIFMCDKWRLSFENFRDWSYKNGFRPELQIDRIDNDKGYSPENCRWVSCKVNQNNRRKSIKFADGETVAEAAARIGISPASLRHRIRSGKMTMEQVRRMPKTPNGGMRKHFNKIKPWEKLGKWEEGEK